MTVASSACRWFFQWCQCSHNPTTATELWHAGRRRWSLLGTCVSCDDLSLVFTHGAPIAGWCISSSEGLLQCRWGNRHSRIWLRSLGQFQPLGGAVRGKALHISNDRSSIWWPRRLDTIRRAHLWRLSPGSKYSSGPCCAARPLSQSASPDIITVTRSNTVGTEGINIFESPCLRTAVIQSTDESTVSYSCNYHVNVCR